MKNIPVLFFAVLGFVFVISGVRLVMEKLTGASIRKEIRTVPFDTEFNSDTARFSIRHPQNALVGSASTSAVTVTYTIKENDQKVRCIVEEVYEPEEQRYLPDYELPEYDTQRVNAEGRQWIYSENPDPKWITLIGGFTYTVRTKDSLHDKLFCERVLDTFRRVE